MASQMERTMAGTTEPESPPKASAKAQRREPLKALPTATVPEKASPMGLLKVPWKSTVSVKGPTMSPTDLSRIPM